MEGSRREAFPVVETAGAKAQRYRGNMACGERRVWRSGEADGAEEGGRERPCFSVRN